MFVVFYFYFRYYFPQSEREIENVLFIVEKCMFLTVNEITF